MNGVKDPPKPELIDRQLKEIEQLVSSAAGLNKERGDSLKVTAVEFMFNENELAPEGSPGLGAMLNSHLGGILNALTAIGIAALIIFFGLAPIRRILLAEPIADASIGVLETEPLTIEPVLSGTGSPVIAMEDDDDLGVVLDGLSNPKTQTARKRLEKLIEQNDEQAAAIMKQWMRS